MVQFVLAGMLVLWVRASAGETEVQARHIAPAVEVEVDTMFGKIVGKVNGTRYETACEMFPLTKVLPFQAVPNVATFLGIPFAEPPVKENRWKPPQPKAAWVEPLQAKQPGSICAQLPGNGITRLPISPIPGPKEDCLYLNVWSPVTPAGTFETELKPILIFISGGGFIGGSGLTEMNCMFYDGSALSQALDAVVVTINYRLGIFGYFAHESLKEESGTTGNYGLQDQRASIKWVVSAAKAFGGDPERITLMGQSAGAASVLHHMVLPRSRELFAQGISMSGYVLSWSLAQAYARSSSMVSSMGCKTLECLRSKSTYELIKAEDTFLFGMGVDVVDRMLNFGPVSDGYELPEGTDLVKEFQLRKATAPLMLGSVMNETNLFQCTGLHPFLTEKEGSEYLLKKEQFAFPNNTFDMSAVETIMSEYGGFPTPKKRTMAIATDLIFTCAAGQVADAAALTGAPVFRYLIGRSPPLFAHLPCLGVPHASDLLWLFSGAFPDQLSPVIVGGDAGKAQQRNMLRQWASFLHTGTPDTDWPQWDPKTRRMVQFGSAASGNMTQLRDYRGEQCAVIDGLLP